MNIPYKNDVGTVLLVDCAADISGATVAKLLIKKPSEKEVEWICSIHSEDKNIYFKDVDPNIEKYSRSERQAMPAIVSRRLKYVIKEGDLDEVGYYIGNAYVELPTWRGRGETFKFRVSD